MSRFFQNSKLVVSDSSGDELEHQMTDSSENSENEDEYDDANEQEKQTVKQFLN